ncbi:MAG: DotI/IcmL family type IV secretion protein [Alphaproteobacteria bacterium]|nr:DotI/IcmL family type IV secretion protein [Alphaproteobacteria bacterium]
MKKKFLFFIAVSVLGFLFIAPFPAQANLIEFFFPSLRKMEYDPSETLQAPFADKKAQEAKPLAKGQLPENALALNLPHRIDDDIGKWVITVISESLSFTEKNYHDDLKKTKTYFTTKGRNQYAKFLRNKSIIKVLESEKFYIRNFVEDTPFILNKGALDGSYHWLFEVPVVLSYMDRSMIDYKEFDSVNQKIVLTIQVGRFVDAENESGVLIELWDGRLKKSDKNNK